MMKKKIYLSLETNDCFESTTVKSFSFDNFIYPSFRLFKRDLIAQRNNSKLEMLWNLIDPIMLSLIFILLYSLNALPLEQSSIPYSFFVISGVLLWHTIIDAFLAPLGLMKKHKILLENTSVSSRVLWGSSLIRCMYTGSFRLLVIVISSVYFDISSFSAVFLYILFFYFTIFLFHSFGLLFSPFNYLSESLERVLNILLRPLFFISGIVFPLPQIDIILEFSKINFFMTSIEQSRNILIGNLENLNIWWAVHVACLFILSLIGLRLFDASVRIVVDKT